MSRRTGESILAALQCGVTLIAAAAFAQDAADPPDPAAPPTAAAPPLTLDETAPPPNDADLRRDGLDVTPFTSELLGLNIHLPANGRVTVQQIEGGVSVLVTDPSANPPNSPQWTLRIGVLESAMQVPTPRHEIDAHIRSLDATGREYTILRNEDHRVRNAVGRHLTIRQMPSVGDEPIVSGWLLLQNSETTFLVLSYVTSPQVYTLLQPLLDASFNTILLRTLDEVDQIRERRVAGGLQFLITLTERNLRAMVGEEQWFRVYRATDAGEEEIGYSFVQVSEAMRGEVEPGRSPEKFSPGERVKGIMITVQGRVLTDASRGVFTDSIARYWVQWDQSDELWGVRATVRQGDAMMSESETGARHVVDLSERAGDLIGDDPRAGDEAAPRPIGARRRTLTVVKSSQRDRSTQPVTWDVPQEYLSQGLGWLVGRMLAHLEAAPRVQSYYFYDPTSNRLVLRTDEWSEAADGDGRWKLRSRMGTDAPAIETRYGADGALLIQRRPDGTIIEPIDLATLRRIWQEKGLPTSTGEDR